MGGIFLLFLLFFLRLSDACLSSRGTLHHDDMERYESCERDKEEIHSDFYLLKNHLQSIPSSGQMPHIGVSRWQLGTAKTDPWMGK